MTRPESEPNHDPAPEPESGASVLSPASRRAFIAGAGAVTVAGAAAVAAGPLVTAGAAAAAPVTTSGGDPAVPGSGGPAVVAYVRNLDSGEVRLMSGEREVVVRDRALARTLARHLDAQEG
jgi:hypothetical protein